MCRTRVNSISGVQPTQDTPQSVSGAMLVRVNSKQNISESHPKQESITNLSDEKIEKDQSSIKSSQLNPQKVNVDFIKSITQDSTEALTKPNTEQLQNVQLKPIGKTLDEIDQGNNKTLTNLKSQEIETRQNTTSFQTKIDEASLTKPTSEQLQSVQLKRVGKTLDEIDQKTQLNPEKLKEQHNNLSEKTDINPNKPIAEDFTKILNTKFRDKVAKLDSVLVKSKVYDESRVTARQTVASISHESLLIRNLSKMNDNELRAEVVKSIGGLKDKHDGKTYEQLPKNKRELVDAIVQGIKDGLPQKIEVRIKNIFIKSESSPLKKNMDEVKTKSKEALLSCTTDVRYNMSLQSEFDIKTKIAKDIGLNISEHNKRWFQSIPEDKQNFINAVYDGFKTSFDTKFEQLSGQKTIKDKEDKDITVPDKITIKGKEYSEPQFLGQGGLGRILKYTNQETGKSVIVKELLEKEKRQDMITEIINHKHAMDPSGEGDKNIVKFMGVAKSEDETLYMIMDEAKGGDMKGVMRKLQNSQDISDGSKALINRFMMKDVLSTMNYVQEERNMIHFDLKPENFLMDENGNAMVADFGSARIGSDDFKDRELVTTPAYSSPEVSSRFDGRNAKFVNQKSDTWSVGMMLNELTGGNVHMFTPDRPEGENVYDYEIEANIKDFGANNENRIRNTSDDKKILTSSDNIVNALMNPDPSKRPTLRAALEHSFFQDPLLNDPNLKELMKEIVKPTDQQDTQKIKNLSDKLDKLNPAVFDKPKVDTEQVQEQQKNWTKVDGKWQQV